MFCHAPVIISRAKNSHAFSSADPTGASFAASVNNDARPGHSSRASRGRPPPPPALVEGKMGVHTKKMKRTRNAICHISSPTKTTVKLSLILGPRFAVCENEMTVSPTMCCYCNH